MAGINVEQQDIITPEGVDSFIVIDSSDANTVKRVTVTGLTQYYDALYAPLAHTHTVSDIQGFDMAVAGNAAVVLNTAKVSYPGDSVIKRL